MSWWHNYVIEYCWLELSGWKPETDNLVKVSDDESWILTLSLSCRLQLVLD